jgi:hypothetical protein
MILIAYKRFDSRPGVPRDELSDNSPRRIEAAPTAGGAVSGSA